MLIVAALTALGVWKAAPGTELDRLAFSAVAAGSANGPLFISGAGSRKEPWALRTFSATPRTDKREAPVIVSIGDDPERFFQSSPPAPIDLAVMFSNFHRLGARKVASAAVLAWEKPDPIGLAALEKSLEKFESLVLAAPLTSGVLPTPMPTAFRRTSMPISAIHGDATQLPLVNGLSISEAILGGDRTIAGFSFLAKELDDGEIPLMARWDERVVFAFPLLTMLQRLDLPLAGMEVRLGEYLKLGPAGPLVPIDNFGRLAMEPKVVSPYSVIPADALIDGGDDLFPEQAPDPVILRDDKSAVDTRTRAFSQGLAGVIAGIASNGGLSDAHEFRRLPENGEAGVLAAVVVALALLGGMSRFVRNIGALALFGIGLAAQWIAFSAGSIWLPGVAVLAAVAVAGALGLLFRDKRPAEKAVPVSTPQSVIPSVPDPPQPRTVEPQQVSGPEPEIVVVPDLKATVAPEPEIVISPEPGASIAVSPENAPQPEPVSESTPAEEPEGKPWWAMYSDDSSPPTSATPEVTQREIAPPISPETTAPAAEKEISTPAPQTGRSQNGSRSSGPQKGRKRR